MEAGENTRWISGEQLTKHFTNFETQQFIKEGRLTPHDKFTGVQVDSSTLWPSLETRIDRIRQADEDTCRVHPELTPLSEDEIRARATVDELFKEKIDITDFIYRTQEVNELLNGLEPAEKKLLEQPEFEENAFIHKGDFWEVIFNGRKLDPIKEMEGFHYLAVLLDKPDKEFNVCDLYTSRHPENPASNISQGDLKQQLQSGHMSVSTMQDEGLDSQGREKIKGRLRKYQEIIDDPESLQIERENAGREKEKLLESVHKFYGLKALRHGAPRKLNAAVKRSYENVTKAVDRAINEIKRQSPDLAEYLLHNLDKGKGCRFKDRDTRWHVSP